MLKVKVFRFRVSNAASAMHDELLQSIINHVIESEEYSKLGGEGSKDD